MVTLPIPTYRVRWNFFAEFIGGATEHRAATPVDAAAAHLASAKPPTHGTVYVEVVDDAGTREVYRMAKVSRWEVA